MLIAIDASRANKAQKTGVEWYSYHIIQELKKIVPNQHQVFLYTNEKLRNGLGECPDNFKEKVLSWPFKYLWTQLRLWWELVVSPPDVLFVPAHTIPFLPIRAKTKVYVVVHDVGFKRFPELYKKIQVWYHELTMKRIKQRVDKIITISQFSKKEINQLYQVKKEKIEVIHLGCKPNLEKSLQTEIKPPYLLFVGRIEKKKNVINMVKSFIALKNKYPDLKLVLAGGQGNASAEVKELIIKEGLKKRVVLTGYLPFHKLKGVLSKAEVFLFPTLYEGFGLPILEAMAVGVPVVASAQKPHQEVGGKAALYADPYDPNDLAQKVEQILENPELKNDLISKGKERTEQFTWQKTAQKIWEVIK